MKADLQTFGFGQLDLSPIMTVPPNMALQRTRRPSLRSGRSLRSLGSPLNAYPLGRASTTEAA